MGRYYARTFGCCVDASLVGRGCQPPHTLTTCMSTRQHQRKKPGMPSLLPIETQYRQPSQNTQQTLICWRAESYFGALNTEQSQSGSAQRATRVAAGVVSSTNGNRAGFVLDRTTCLALTDSSSTESGLRKGACGAERI